MTYYMWRKAVFARDGSRCALCGSTERLECDHIKSYRNFPDGHLDPNNGRVLCHGCHVATPTYGGKQLKGTRRDEIRYGGIG